MTKLGGWMSDRATLAVAILFSLLFVILAVLGIMDRGIALTLLVMIAGIVVGHELAYLVARTLKRWFDERFVRWRGVVAYIVGAAVGFTVLIVGLVLLGLPSLFSEEGGFLGTFVWGLALGFGTAFPYRILAPPQPTPEEARQNRRAVLQGLLILGGILTFILGLSFGLFFLIEYVAAPLIRYFAA